MNRPTALRSFSLVEIVVAMAILVVALMGATALVLTSTSLSRTSRERAEVIALADARVAQLRATLRSADIEDNRDAQYQAVLAAIGPTGGGGVYQSAAAEILTINEGKTNVSLIVTAYTREDTAEAQLGLTGLDINADGITGSATVHPTTDLYMLPIRVQATFRASHTRTGDPDTVITIDSILY